MGSIYDWSVTPFDNQNSDVNINWLEGQPTDTVNNSARAMMARQAEWMRDLGGTITTGGTANALTATLNSRFTQLATGRMAVLKASLSNTGAATLNINGIGARSIKKYIASGESDLSANDIRAGGLYSFVYDAAANGGAGAWILLNPSTPQTKLAPTVTITDNSSNLPSPVDASGTMLRLASSDGNPTSFLADAFGAGTPRLQLRRAKGTAAAPTAVVANDVVGEVSFHGRGQSGYFVGAQAQAVAAENWTDSAQGTDVVLSAKTYGTTTLTERLRIGGNGVVQLWGQGVSTPQFKIDNGTVASLLAIDGTLGKAGTATAHDFALMANNVVGLQMSQSDLSIQLSSTTDASSTTTGALRVTGGVGIAKKLYVGDYTLISQASGATSTPVLELSNGSYAMAFRTRSSAGAGNGLVQAGDASILFHKGAVNTGSIVIGSWSTDRGLRMDASGIWYSPHEIRAGIGNGNAQFRLRASTRSALLVNDNTATWILLTDTPDGSFNALRPLRITNASGNVELGNAAITINHGGGVLIGNPAGGNLGVGTLNVDGELRARGGLVIGSPTGGNLGAGTANIADDLLVGGDVTIAGALNMPAALAVASGGTGATTPNAALQNLGIKAAGVVHTNTLVAGFNCTWDATTDTVSFDSPLGSNNYVAVVTPISTGADHMMVSNKTPSSFRISRFNSSGHAFGDPQDFSFIVLAP